MNTSYVTGTNGFRDPTPTIHPAKSESLEGGEYFKEEANKNNASIINSTRDGKRYFPEEKKCTLIN